MACTKCNHDGESGCAKKRILLVDELELMHGYGKLLEAVGYRVTGTHRGDFALIEFEQQDYDVVIIAPQIGEMEPLELAYAILRRRSDVPVIVLRNEAGITGLRPGITIVENRFSALRKSVGSL